MLRKCSTAVVAAALASALATTMITITSAGGAAADDGKYPANWQGQWARVIHREVEVQGAFDQTKPWGLGQDAPLTPEYRKVLADSMADQATGGLGNYPTARCLPAPGTRRCPRGWASSSSPRAAPATTTSTAVPRLLMPRARA